MAASFEIRRTSTDGDSLCLEVKGLLDAYTGLRLRDELSELLTADAAAVQIDASDVSFLDSGGLRVLVDAARELEDRGGKLQIVDPSETVVQVLEITDLMDRFGL